MHGQKNIKSWERSSHEIWDERFCIMHCKENKCNSVVIVKPKQSNNFKDTRMVEETIIN